ncbi:hypothetical protein MHB63_16560 [Bacillus sp. FSL H8-0547]
MQITWMEMKKALGSPVILCLLGLFISFNLFTIFSGADNKAELKVVNHIVEEYGLTFDDSILNTMQEHVNEDVRQFDSSYQDADAFLKSMTFEHYSMASKEEQQEIDRIGLMQMYIGLGKSLDERYSELDADQMRDKMVKELSLSGFTEEVVSAEYKKLDTRLEEMKGNAEYKQWFFAGDYRMHTELFRSLLKNTALEGVMLVVLLTALISNYEFENRSQLVAYTTKRGRKLIWNKLAASLLSTLLLIVPLFGISLLAYFQFYDYSGLWHSLISSGLNWEYKLPYITRWPIEFHHYLWMAIAILSLILMIVSLLTFALSIVIKNSYMTWIVMILLLVSMFVIPSFFAGIPLVLILMNFNLTLLLVNPHMYFSGVSGLTMFEHYEIVTLASWFAAGVVISSLAMRRFYRKDIV